MTFFKVYKSWTLVGTMPLFRALIVDGAIYYFVLAFTFGLDVVANMNSEVSELHPIVSNRALLTRYSCITPSWTPSM